MIPLKIFFMKMRWLTIIALVSKLVTPMQGLSITTGKPIECVYYRSSTAKISAVNTNDDILPAETSQVVTADGWIVNVTMCSKPSDYCYALWKINEDFSYDIISQGCWESSGSADCQSTQCASSGKATTLMHRSHFCCCEGSRCNLNMGVSNQTAKLEDLNRAPELPSDTVSLVGASNSSSNAVLVTVILCSSAFVFGIVFVIISCNRRRYFTSKSFKHLSQENSDQPLLSDPSLESLRLVDLVGQGRYGIVWKASLDEKLVAVKIFHPSSRCYFNNERNIFCLPQLSHNNIVKFFGYVESPNSSGHVESKLILEFAPHGCLQEFLRHNSVDFDNMVKMGCSVSKGLAYLHTDFQQDDQLFSIVHRDFNSRNVLVKSDLTCCLCDFGFAMQVSGSHYVFNGEQQHAETSSLSDVGTLRYMAPEVLEGAVNLRECESSLKQVDVYALSLVLWEIAYRCSELYPCKEANPYIQPFEDSIGSHPSLEQMKVLVCRNKARPTIPDVWKDSNPSIRLLKDTLTDAWDADAEARLTSLCVEERWSDLKLIWDREKVKKGFSPNLRSNATRLGEHACKNDSNLSGVRPEGDVTRDITVSLQKNKEVWTQLVPLQPHQGRNRCLERNTMPVTEEMSIDGNSLVERSFKNEIHRTAHPPDNVQSTSTSSSEPVDVIRVAQPIPYVQNAVRGSDSNRELENNEGSSQSLGQLLVEFFRGNRSKRVEYAGTNDRRSKLNNQDNAREPVEVPAEEQELHDVGKQGQHFISLSFPDDFSSDSTDSRKQNGANHLF